MSKKKLLADARDEIVEFMEHTGRKLKWLADVTDINYNTLFSILKQKTISLSQDNLDKINKALDTDFEL